jgi:riboflavin kinase/FMN adenylyltransferase
MDIYNTYKNLPDKAKGAVIAIGNFDGIHRGHQKLLDVTRSIAKENNKPMGVLTFEPHPRRLFRSDDPPFRITPVSLKARRLEEAAVDIMFSVDFDWSFASQSAEDFIENVLKSGIDPSHIVVGYDFCFGQLRKGNAETLKKAGLEVTVIEKVEDDGEALSSSRIRSELRHGHVEKANEILGWAWELEGIVVEGDKRGRKLGFPTANIPLEDTLHPAYGVYAAKVKIVEDGPDAPWLLSATNIGIRPMFELETGQIEAHILDFDRDIYGKTLRVRPVKHLRGEARFEDIDGLIKQINSDCKKVREIFEG